jgi:peroxiredoxin
MRFPILVPSLLVVSLLFSSCADAQSSSKAQASSTTAKSALKVAPDFELTDSTGKTARLSDYRGKVVLLNFWATWCGPCKVEMPWFMDFERKYKDKGFAVLAVAMDEDGWPSVRPYLRDSKIDFRVLMFTEKVAEQYGGVEDLPQTLVIDQKGNIIAKHVGLVSKSEYEKEIQRLLGLPATPPSGVKPAASKSTVAKPAGKGAKFVQ